MCWKVQGLSQSSRAGSASRSPERNRKRKAVSLCEPVCLVAQSCLTLCDPVNCHPPDSSVHGDFPGKNTEAVAMPSSRGPPQPGIQARSPAWQIHYRLSHQGSPGILEWISYPFSRGSSQPRNPTTVFCIAEGFFTHWAAREAQSFFFSNFWPDFTKYRNPWNMWIYQSSFHR